RGAARRASAISFYTLKSPRTSSHCIPGGSTMRKQRQRSFRLAGLVLTSVLVAACASSGTTDDTGTGGASASGGATGSGTGGETARGGTTGTGGAATGTGGVHG